MQVTIRHGGGIVIHATPADTYAFATRPGASWPGSALKYEPVTLELSRSGDLIDLEAPEDVTADELGAFQEYALEQAMIALGEARKVGA